MVMQFGNTGTYTNSTFREYNSNHHIGFRTCLGFVGAQGASYIHIKTNIGGSSNNMVKFEYNGFTYSGNNVHTSVTLYTYEGSANPYQPHYVSWGASQHGIVNTYYSSDDYLVVVIRTSSAYTGGFLYYQAGRSHYQPDVDIMSFASSNDTSGAF